MKNSILTIATVVLTATVITTSCNTSEQKVKDAKENVADAQQNVINAANDLDNANKEYLADVESYRLTTQQKIDANNKIITDFKVKIKAEKKEVKAEYNKKIEALELKNTAAKKRMDEYKEEGKDKWQSFKREVNHDMDELEKSLNDLTVNNTK